MPDVYCARFAPDVSGSIGEHVRHCLDHVSALLAADPSRTLSYDRRQRGTTVETDPGEALRQILQLKSALDAWSTRSLDEPLRVTSMMSASDDARDRLVHARSRVGLRRQPYHPPPSHDRHSSGRPWLFGARALWPLAVNAAAALSAASRCAPSRSFLTTMDFDWSVTATSGATDRRRRRRPFVASGTEPRFFRWIPPAVEPGSGQRLGSCGDAAQSAHRFERAARPPGRCRAVDCIIPELLDAASWTGALDMAARLDPAQFDLFRLVLAQRMVAAVVTSDGRALSVETMGISDHSC